MQYPCSSGGHYYPLPPEHFKPINKFHPSFPDLDSYLEAEEQKAAGSIWTKQEIPDILLRLPAELSAIIFSFLSPVSLDAARCVSRAWRLRISSDKRILSLVLTPEPPSIPDETPKELHRRLLKQLDLENAISRISNHPDAWRLHFQETTLKFVLPPRCKHQHRRVTAYKSYFSSVAICDAGDFIALMTKDFTGESPTPINEQSGSTLLFYRLGLFSQPCYIGSIQYSRSQPYPPVSSAIRKLSTVSCGRGWVLKLDMGDHVTCYLVEPCNGFGKDEKPYILEPLGSFPPRDMLLENRNAEESRLFISLSNTFGNSQKKYKALACLPKFRPTVSFPSSVDRSLFAHIYLQGGEISSFHGARYGELVIGNHADEADLFLLRVSTLPEGWRKSPNMEKEPTGDDQRIQKVAVVCAPTPNVVFKNVAVTSHLIGEQMVIGLKHIVIAIIWQKPSSDFSELYVYRIPENFGTGSSVSLPEIHGNRISSLSNRMGGFHQHSILNPRANHSTDGIPGDMLIPSLIYQREQSINIDEIAQKIIVRGATTYNAVETDPDSKNITLRVFDLFVPKPPQTPQNYGRVPSRPKIRGSVQARFACACPLHDTGYRLTLPATWHKVATDLTMPSSPFTWHKSVSTSSTLTPLPTYSYPFLSSVSDPSTGGRGTPFTPTKASLFWKRELPSWMRNKPIEWTVEYQGRVEEDDPQERKDALGREGEYVKELIRAMKEEGMTEMAISNAWVGFDSGLRKPDGWKDL